ncbi:hypothetical protein LOTGIDRAFT_186614 [Lottia gigantea]|uniref:Transmembrane protein 33 n=1 Tax=Lottia gigantea TaxID=225164 RepID=V4CDM2_LOTGI|nr:hypothetical protein LOTGIDRAFT_186614 [Lottia gigantea]ESP00025.1 hypothetical protein LOTGIDRAFT_186614 [Lottia gigantea]
MEGENSTENASNNSAGGSNGQAGNTSGGTNTQSTSVLAFMMENKVAAGLWLTRIITVIFTILFILPFLGGDPYSFYQRALISCAATSALRLHQRIPNFQLSRQFISMLFLEDSCHYLMFSILFINMYPITMALIPCFLFALLHACTYTKSVLNVMGPNSMMFLRNMITKLELQQTNILRFIACNEIFLMPAIIMFTFTGKASIFMPFVYYRFLSLRYSSRRNPYCRTLFSELRMTVEYLCNKPQCPQFIRNLLFQGISIVSRLAPAPATAQ